jgi:hypothetical protein
LGDSGSHLSENKYTEKTDKVEKNQANEEHSTLDPRVVIFFNYRNKEFSATLYYFFKVAWNFFK